MSTRHDFTEDDGWFVAEDKQFVFTANDALGNIADVTGWTIVWRLASVQYGAAVLEKTADVSANPTGGICVVTVDSVDTISMEPETYYYDLRRTDAGARAELAYGSAVLRDTWTDP